MFTLLTRKWRWRAASLLVAAYALCVVAPAAAMVISSSNIAAHCLTDEHHGVAAVHSHVHADGMAHSHPGNDHPANKADDNGQPGQCCGLFCLSAIAPDLQKVTATPPATSPVAATIADCLSGRGSDRIDRPPRSLESL